MDRERDMKALNAVADFLRRRGIPCGVWRVPPPSEIEEAQSAFDAELERIITDMMTDVPAALAEV